MPDPFNLPGSYAQFEAESQLSEEERLKRWIAEQQAIANRAANPTIMQTPEQAGAAAAESAAPWHPEGTPPPPQPPLIPGYVPDALKGVWTPGSKLDRHLREQAAASKMLKEGGKGAGPNIPEQVMGGNINIPIGADFTKDKAERAKKISALYKLMTGGMALQPDVHLALTVSPLPLEEIGKMMERNPESLGMVKDKDIIEPVYPQVEGTQGGVRIDSPDPIPGNLGNTPQVTDGPTEAMHPTSPPLIEHDVRGGPQIDTHPQITEPGAVKPFGIMQQQVHENIQKANAGPTAAQNLAKLDREEYQRQMSPTYQQTQVEISTYDTYAPRISELIGQMSKVEEEAIAGNPEAQKLLGDLDKEGITKADLVKNLDDMKKAKFNAILKQDNYRLIDWQLEPERKRREDEAADLLAEVLGGVPGQGHEIEFGEPSPETGLLPEPQVKTLPPTIADKANFIQTEDYWYHKRGAVMFADTPDQISSNLVILLNSDPNYKADDPATKSEKVLKLQHYLNTFYVDNAGEPLYPVVEDGRLDDKSTFLALNQLNFERAKIIAILFPNEEEKEGEVSDLAFGYIDAYMQWLDQNKQDPHFNTLMTPAYDKIGTPESDDRRSFEQQSKYYVTRQHYAQQYVSLIDNLEGYLAAGDRYSKMAIVDPVLIEARDMSNRDDVLRTVYSDAIKLRNPNVTPAEFAWWWNDNLGGNAVPEEVRNTYLVTNWDATKQAMADLVGDVAEPVRAAFDAIPEPAKKELAVVVDGWHEALKGLKKVATVTPIDDAAGAVSSRAGQAIDVALDLQKRTVMTAWLMAMSRNAPNWTEDMTEAKRKQAEANPEMLHNRLNPFSPHDYDYNIAGDVKKYFAGWKEAWDKAGEDQAQGESPAGEAFRTFTGKDLHMDYPEFAFTADLATDLILLKYGGASLDYAKDIFAGKTVDVLKNMGFVEGQMKMLSDLAAQARVASPQVAENLAAAQKESKAAQLNLTDLKIKEAMTKNELSEIKQEGRAAAKSYKTASQVAVRETLISEAPVEEAVAGVVGREAEIQAESATKFLNARIAATEVEQRLASLGTDIVQAQEQAYNKAALAGQAANELWKGADPYDVMKAMPSLMRRDQFELVNRLRFNDGVDDIARIISGYESEMGLAGGSVYELFADNLTSASREIWHKLIDNNALSNLPKWMQKLTVPFPYNDTRNFATGSLSEKVMHTATAAGYKSDEVGKWVNRLHELAMGGGSKKRAFFQTLNEMELDYAKRTAAKRLGDESQWQKVRELAMEVLGIKNPEEFYMQTEFSPKPMFAGGKKSADVKALNKMETDQHLTKYRAEADELLTRPFEKITGWEKNYRPPGVEDTDWNKISDVSREIVDELTFVAEKEGTIYGNVAERKVLEREITAHVQEGYMRGLGANVISEEGFKDFLGSIMGKQDLMDRYMNRMLRTGINPLSEPKFAELLARYNGMSLGAAESKWWPQTKDLDVIGKIVAPNVDIDKTKQIITAIRKMSQEMRKKEKVAVFPFQMRPYHPTLMRELTLINKYGLNDWVEGVTRLTLADKWMKVWRAVSLFGLGTQLRMMSDEGLRMVDQKISPLASLGIGKYKSTLPPVLNNNDRYWRALMQSFEPGLFEVVGGKGGRAYKRHEFETFINSLSKGETGNTLKEWLAAEADVNKFEGGKSYLFGKLSNAQEKAAFMGGGGKELLQNTGYANLMELEGLVSKESLNALVRVVDGTFRDALRLHSDPVLNKLVAEAGSEGVKISKSAWGKLNKAWAANNQTLPATVVPKKFFRDQPYYYANQAATSTYNALTGAAFTPLEKMTNLTRAGAYRHFYYDELQRYLGGRTLEELPEYTSRLVRELADTYAMSKTDELLYSGFRTAYESRMRNIMPFGAAWRDFITYWTKAGVQRPTRGLWVAKMHQDLPEDVELPDWAKGGVVASFNAIGLDSLSPLASMKLHPKQALFFTGGMAGYIPAFGPLVTQPLSWLQQLKPDTFDWISQIPGLGFVNPDSPMFAKLDKFIWGLSGKIPGWQNAPMWGRHLSAPLGFTGESVSRKEDAEYQYAAKEYLDSLDLGKIGELNDAQLQHLKELRHDAKDAVEDNFILQFLGQYSLPTGFTETSPGQTITTAINTYANANAGDKDLLKQFYLGFVPKESLPEKYRDAYYINVLPDDKNIRETFASFAAYQSAPTLTLPKDIMGGKTSKSEYLALNPGLIPYVVGTTVYNDDGYSPKPVSVLAEETAGKFEDIIKSQYGDKWRDVRGDINLGGKLGYKRRQKLESLRDELAAKAPGGKLWPGTKIPGTELNLRDTLDKLPTQSEALSAKEKAQAAFAHFQSSPELSLSGKPPDMSNMEKAERALALKANADKFASFDVPPEERTDQDWINVGMPDEPNRNGSNWRAIYEAMNYWKDVMYKETGSKYTQFDDKKGRPYAYALDAQIEVINSAAGPEFRRNWQLSQGPQIEAMEALGVGLNDPKTSAMWQEAYGIFRTMVEEMKAAPNAVGRDAANEKAMQQIAALKKENADFAAQIDQLNKETTNPTKKQLTASERKYSTYSSSTESKGGSSKLAKPKKPKKAKKLKTRRGSRKLRKTVGSASARRRAGGNTRIPGKKRITKRSLKSLYGKVKV